MQNKKIDSPISAGATNLEISDALHRVPVHFRLASCAKLLLINQAEKTGTNISSILESIAIEYLKHKADLKVTINTEPKQTNTEPLLKLSPLQLTKLLSTHLRAINDSYNFTRDTGINPEAQGFNFFTTTALLEIFHVYFTNKGIKIPSLDQLIKDAAKGYKIAAFGGPKIVKISDEELQQMLLMIAQ